MLFSDYVSLALLILLKIKKVLKVCSFLQN